MQEVLPGMEEGEEGRARSMVRWRIQVLSTEIDTGVFNRDA